MKIKRDWYLGRLVSRKWNGMIKVVAGMRRSGKSYLLFRLFVEHLKAEGVPDDRIVRIELDRKENECLRSADALYGYIMSKTSRRGKYYVLIDEIQLAGDDFYEVLNSLLHYDNIDTYVTSSNSKFLVTDIVTEFRGRSDEIIMRPLIMENVIYNELRHRGWEVDVGVVETWGKDVNGKKSRKPLEIDFVCNKGSGKIYIQSAFTIPDRAKMEQEQRPFSCLPDSFRRVMIVKDAAMPWYNEDGTLVVGLRDFLLDPSSLEKC